MAKGIYDDIKGKCFHLPQLLMIQYILLYILSMIILSNDKETYTNQPPKTKQCTEIDPR